MKGLAFSSRLGITGAAPDAGIDKTAPGHVLRVVDVAQIDHDRRGESRFDAIEIERAKRIPFGHDDQRVGLVAAGIGIEKKVRPSRTRRA